jgi:hypothetical protein
MKPAFTSFVSAALVALTAACTTSGITARPRNAGAGVFASQGAGFGPELLRKMNGLTALDALRMVPAYYGSVDQQPPTRFVLTIDGLRHSDVEALKSIQAVDVLEIRVVKASQTKFGDAEITVTTVGGRGRTR